MPSTPRVWTSSGSELADEGAKAERERKRRCWRIVEAAGLTVAAIVMLILVATASGPFKGIGR